MKKMEKKAKYETIFVLIMLLLINLSYLVYSHYSPTKNNFCQITNKFSCDVVNKSSYSELAHIPVAVIGIIGFLVILFFFYQAYIGTKEKNSLEYSGMLLIVAIIASLSLIFIESFILKMFCPLCMLGDLFILAIAAIFLSLKVKINNNISKIIISGVILLLFGILYAAFNAFLL
jgi:uncharacterized membrane protein